ncbi:DUF6932 family protein [Methanobrevibacter sp.]|uniref:DUF6932 family protein n=2 Tax=Methanobrevibacter sp. TaxID=66852 RepID=UPI00386C6F1C
MKIKKFNGFNEYGYLPYGMYNLTINEIEKIFSRNSSKRRKEIMEIYKIHLNEIQNTGYYLDHWIGGSFITTKENPNDIDTLTEFDGEKVDENDDKKLIDDLINNSKEKTDNLCHSLRLYKYPPQQKEDFKRYINQKRRILINLYGQDRKNIKKGIVHLILGE